MSNVSSLLVNLSNQGNIFKGKKSSVSQFNFIVMIGNNEINNIEKKNGISISIDINKLGEISIDGLDENQINDENIKIYADKKVTNSEK
ncbi:hypothetical protein CLPU_10c01210 [Gottschalkia purinilytica]|uniref:Uncharacterized protein n=1 Tax=Gottschalkia purinilytica TaxID=1503 RepID=A0A0L0W9F1_GOTPU|nr:hypothetical protein [Gottschalkia purinilytica]KNF08066.1 hypothetical protein CLPU_10c01210 [Gottschalkia purinilytica]